MNKNTIAIVTYYNNGSYGAVMQAWALQQAIMQLGYKSYVVRYTMQYPLASPLWRTFFSRSIDSFRNRVHDYITRRHINHFAEKQLLLTPQTFRNISELRNNPPEANVYICGSDQIWNTWRYDQGRGVDYGYFLDFGNIMTRRIAYAASFGRASLPSGFQQAIKSQLQRFDEISVREIASVGLVREICAKEAQLVLDPTLLLNSKDYSILTNRAKFLESGGARFFLGSGKAVVKDLTDKLRMSVRLKFYNIGGTVENWLGSIANSSFVFTDSFHAVAFSIIFHRPFLVLLRNGGKEGRNVRLLSLLSLLGLSDRAICAGDEESVVSKAQQPIDWDCVELRLRKLRAKSLQFLTKALGE